MTDFSKPDLLKPWDQYSFVAFDTETSSAYPIGSDVVEFGAVRWQGGVIVDELQLLIKPREPMSDFIIGIHGITNEMVATAPTMSEVIPQIAEFMRGHILMAHHAPFDLGFMTFEYEKHGLALPEEPVLCTSLLSRRLIASENHRLQTLVQFLGIDGGAAHRALDDARSCLHVGLRSFEKLGPQATLQDILTCQEKTLEWKNFVIHGDERPLVQQIKRAVEGGQVLDFIYDKGAEFRQAKPLGLVKSPDGDFLYAHCLRDQTNKRFYLSRVKEVRLT